MKPGMSSAFAGFCYYENNIFSSFNFVSLELNMELPSGPASTAIGASTQASTDQDELTARLARLRQAE